MKKDVHNLNIFAGPNAMLDYLDPAKHAPASLVELPQSFILANSSLKKKDKVRIFLKMTSEWPMNTLKLAAVYHWYMVQKRQGKLTKRTVCVIASSGGAALPFVVIGRRFGVQVEVIMPKDAPMFKRMLVELANRKPVILSEEVPGKTGPDIARAMGDLLNHLVFDQYLDETNSDGHEEVTVAQIWRQAQALGIGLSGIAFAVGTSGTGNAVVSSLDKHHSDAIPVGVICAEGNPLPGMRSLSRLSPDQVPLFHKYGYAHYEVERYPSYQRAVQLLSDVGLKVGLTTGGVVEGTFRALEKIAEGDLVTWRKIANKDGERVFVGISADLLDLYLPQLSTILDPKDM